MTRARKMPAHPLIVERGKLKLENVMRFRDAHNRIAIEHIVRGATVEIIEYFPSGEIMSHVKVDLDWYIEEMSHLRDTAPTPD